MNKKISIYLFFSFIMLSCDFFQPKKEQKIVPQVEEELPKPSEKEKKFINEIDNTTFKYALKGKKEEDFIEDHFLYQIQYKEKGDLNSDGLSDMVLVVKHQKIPTYTRYILILLQDKDQNYHLDTISNTIFEPEYNEYDYKWYDSEEIEIKNNILLLSFYGSGASGNIFYKFEYKNKDFLLTYMETFAAGAGGQTSNYYDLKKGEIVTVEINTMEEEMPETTTTKQMKKTIYKFNEVSYELVMSENE